jgi:hypothetical protein
MRKGIVFGIIFFLGVAAVGGGLLAAAEEPRPGEARAEELTAWDHIQVALDRVYDLTWPMATALAGVGIATMAVFQMAKDLFHVRRRFYQKRVREWLKDRAAAKPGINLNKAEESLVTLATAGDAGALYSLEIDKLAGQINAAARMALDYPRGHEDLIHGLAAQADAGDLQKVLNPPASPAPSASDEEKKRARDQAAVYLEAKNRVATHIQRTLDGFQITQEYRWKHWNQVWAFWLNFAFVMAVLIVNSYRAGGYRTDTPAYLLVALLGGFVAPVAKDLVSALEALKGRKR